MPKQMEWIVYVLTAQGGVVCRRDGTPYQFLTVESAEEGAMYMQLRLGAAVEVAGQTLTTSVH